ncbi:MAG: aspartate/glutamate racemase family protein [Ectothiorhodospiraceae bacterium]|nr:aspartate/glutamate racemase family protein [Chromatiales bacterium]MCP5153865.1 aspartate/glutamate racemase family protein [Ectothiorhodospiraceae bacterium]
MEWSAPSGTDTLGRLGVLVPSSNTSVEAELREVVPRAVSVHVGRLPLTRIAESSIARILSELESESRKLATAGVDLILLGATAPSFLKGVGYDREVSARIEAATGKPATTTSTAMLEALAALGARRVSLGAAYDDEVNAIAAAFLEANGHPVACARGLGYVDNLAVGRLPVETAFDLGREVDHPDAECIVLACTNWLSMAAIAPLEAALGKPVISTTQASIWACLRRLGYTAPISGYGRLLEAYLGEGEVAPARAGARV